jgi:hypothetical protein
MNQLATSNERLPMDSVGMSTGSNGAKIAPQNLAEVVKFAEVMCRADIALPKHLRGNAGACMAVALQALDWQMNPFAVASKSYQVNGSIAYEAQLIAAVVNTRSGIKGRLKYRYEGTGNDMTCTVTGMIDGDELEYTTPPIGSITTKNSPLWKSDPQQQLGYFAARSWARRHTPEVILGVYDREEAEQFQGPDNARDVTPAQPSVMERLRAAQETTQQPADEREGFDAAFVHSETETALTGEILDNTNTDEPAPHSSVDAGHQPAEGEMEPSPSVSPSNIERDLKWLLNVARMLWAASSPGGDIQVLKTQKSVTFDTFPKPENCDKRISDKANAVFKYCSEVVELSMDPEDGLAMVAGVVGVDQDDILRKAGDA